MNKSKFALSSIACLISIAASTAHADQLADIKSRGTLICGVLTTLEPFGFMDPQSRTVVGYDVDFCNAIAKHLGVKPELKQLSLDARIPELSQGRVDVLAAVLGYNATRATQIDFTYSYFLSENKVAVQEKSGFKSLADLDGKRVSSIKGSSTQAMLRNSIPNVNVVSYDDAPSAFMALTQRKVDGFGLTEAMLRRFIAKLGDDSGMSVISTPVGKEYWGLGIKKEEPQLLAAVNDALKDMESTGEAQQIFDKWLGQSSIYKMDRSFKIEPIAQ